MSAPKICGQGIALPIANKAGRLKLYPLSDGSVALTLENGRRQERGVIISRELAERIMVEMVLDHPKEQEVNSQ